MGGLTQIDYVMLLVVATAAMQLWHMAKHRDD